MTSFGDPAVRQHLAYIRDQYSQAGVIEYIRDIVRETWRSNRERWSPDIHFDDTNTLGYQTSRNVNNRVSKTMHSSGISPAVRAETELGVVILELAGHRLRVVKAPIECGLTPDFNADFNWTTSVTREAAARRNSNNYYPLATGEPTLDFEGDPRPVHRRRVEFCRDLFLLWAAQLTSNRTVGWLGLPRLGDLPWMGVTELWLDEPEPGDTDADLGQTTKPNTGSHAEDEDEDED